MKRKYINTNLGIVDRRDEDFWFSYFSAYLKLQKSREDISKELGITTKILCTIFKNLGYLYNYKHEIKEVSRKWRSVTVFDKYGAYNIFKTEYAKNKTKQTKKRNTEMRIM